MLWNIYKTTLAHAYQFLACQNSKSTPQNLGCKLEIYFVIVSKLRSSFLAWQSFFVIDLATKAHLLFASVCFSKVVCDRVSQHHQLGRTTLKYRCLFRERLNVHHSFSKICRSILFSTSIQLIQMVATMYTAASISQTLPFFLNAAQIQHILFSLFPRTNVVNCKWPAGFR